MPDFTFTGRPKKLQRQPLKVGDEAHQPPLSTLRQRGREGEGDALIPRLLRPRNWTKDEGDETEWRMERLGMRRDSKIKAHQKQDQ